MGKVRRNAALRAVVLCCVLDNGSFAGRWHEESDVVLQDGDICAEVLGPRRDVFPGKCSRLFIMKWKPLSCRALYTLLEHVYRVGSIRCLLSSGSA